MKPSRETALLKDMLFSTDTSCRPKQMPSEMTAVTTGHSKCSVISSYRRPPLLAAPKSATADHRTV